MPLPGEVIATIVNAVADPAANNEIIYTADGDMYVYSVHFTLTTDATVANRRVELRADDGSNIFWRSYGPTNQAASLIVNYCAFQGAAPLDPGGVGTFIMALPTDGLRLRKGDRLFTATSSRQAGDDYGVMRLLVEYLP